MLSPINRTPEGCDAGDRAVLHFISDAAALGCVVLSLLGLIAYIPGLRLVGSIRPEYIPMAPSTAVSFIIFSSALYSAQRPVKKSIRALIVSLCILATLFGILKIAGDVVGMDLSLEHHLVPDFGDLNGIPIARMSPSTAAFFFFVGIGLLPVGFNKDGHDSTATFLLPGVMGTALLFGSMTFMLGYLLGTPLLYGREIVPMALTSAFGFFLMGVGLVCFSGPERFPVKLFYGEKTAARLMRVILPLCIGALITHSVVSEFLRQLANWNDALSVALLAAVFSLITAGMVNRISRFIGDRVDRSELELYHSREKYKALFNSIRDAMLVADTRRKIVGCNPAFQELFGYSEAEIVGKPTLCIYDDEQQFAELGRKIADNIDKTNFFSTITYRKKSGETFSGETNVFFLRSADGAIGGFIGQIRDITERLKAEEIIRRSQDRLKALVNNQFDALVVTDVDGIILYANQAAMRLFDKDSRQLIGTRFSFPITFGETFEIAIDAAEKSTRYAEARATVTDWGGDLAVLMSIRDITEKRLALMEREKMNEHLKQAQKLEAIGTLAGGIAHDFNNILSSIIGFSELALEKVEKNSFVEDSLQEVFAAGRRAKELVRQILMFARQSNDEVNPLVPGVIVKEVLKFIRSSIPVTIEIQQEINSDAMIMGNPTQFHQVLMNLCTNAAQAMEDSGGILSVVLRDAEIAQTDAEQMGLAQGRYVEMSVSDTGIGIAPEIIDAVFEPYFTTKAPGEGTGLGLAVVHGIVESYGGKITIDSRLGRGTTVRIYLPITQKPSSAPTTETSSLPTGREHILLVDDEFPIVKMTGSILTGLGYSVTTQTSSIEALRLIKSGKFEFDLVITDMTMPNMTGARLAGEIIALHPDLPVILCTGYSRNMNSKEAQRIGIRAFVYKPVVKADLARTVRKVLDEQYMKVTA